MHTNGVRLHVAEAGPKDGRPVILLHGFPEFWYGWRKQIPALAEAGYRVLAPDQRGYNRSDKPSGIAAYNLDTLADDVVGLMEALGEKQAVVAGHDWGAAVAWWLAGIFPERVKKMVVMNVPHHSVMRRTLRRSWRQRIRSWYMLYFQLPWLPELSLRLGGHWAATQALRRTSRPGTFGPRELAAYRQAWEPPGAWRGMLNWYRAILRSPPNRRQSARIRVPTLVIWGEQDAALMSEMAHASVSLCEWGRLEMIPQASHWVQHEEPEKVNELMLKFLAT